MSGDEDDSIDSFPEVISPLVSRVNRDASRSLARRSENIQILIATGVLTLAGTLFVQGKISFPILESVAESGLVRNSFRIFIYLTAIFLMFKLITSALYPGSENDYLVVIHEWVEPFVYVGSSMLLLSIVIGTIIIQNTPPYLLEFLPPVLWIIPAVISLSIGYLVAKRTSGAYEESREADINELKSALLMALVNQHAYNRPVIKEVLIKKASPSHQQSLAKEAINEMANNPEIPVRETNEGVFLERDRIDEIAQILLNSGYSKQGIEARLRHFEGFDEE